ncbi:conserved hypothetical protein [Verrucomicrobia bacterium]|nr:conserved hypothetical protein [Verrucomicrobiota bacterium]
MGLLNIFTKPTPSLLRLPTGSFSVDREGCVLIGTLPSSFPAPLIDDIAQQVLALFREAAAAQLPLSEVVINYPSLKITARELRGGAIVFLCPKAPYATACLN